MDVDTGRTTACNQPVVSGAGLSSTETLLELLLVHPFSAPRHLALMAAEQRKQTDPVAETVRRLGALAQLRRSGQRSLLAAAVDDLAREAECRGGLAGSFDYGLVDFLRVYCLPSGGTGIIFSRPLWTTSTD